MMNRAPSRGRIEDGCGIATDGRGGGPSRHHHISKRTRRRDEVTAVVVVVVHHCVLLLLGVMRWRNRRSSHQKMWRRLRHRRGVLLDDMVLLLLRVEVEVVRWRHQHHRLHRLGGPAVRVGDIGRRRCIRQLRWRRPVRQQVVVLRLRQGCKGEDGAAIGAPPASASCSGWGMNVCRLIARRTARELRWRRVR